MGPDISYLVEVFSRRSPLQTVQRRVHAALGNLALVQQPVSVPKERPALINSHVLRKSYAIPRVCEIEHPQPWCWFLGVSPKVSS